MGAMWNFRTANLWANPSSVGSGLHLQRDIGGGRCVLGYLTSGQISSWKERMWLSYDHDKRHDHSASGNRFGGRMVFRNDDACI
jgi:hypothetical protein